jgi:hypothetical protein
MHRIRRRACAAVVLAACCLGQAARGAPDEPPPGISQPSTLPMQNDAPAAATRPLPPVETAIVPGHWYGWQILLADLGVLGLIVGGTALSSEVSNAYVFLPILGFTIYIVDAPILESVNQNPERVPWTLGRRFLIPVAVGLVGFGIGALGYPSHAGDSDCTGPCAGAVGATFGVLIGMVGAMIYDWIASSTPDRPALPRAATSGIIWAPVVMVGPRTQMAGVVVRF